MAKRSYRSQRRKKAKKKRGFASMLKLIFISLIILLVLGFLSFRYWRSSQQKFIRTNSQTVKTTLGNIEYQSIGTGPILLLSHMGGSGSDNVQLMQKFADEGFRVLCPSRPGYKDTPLVPNANFSYQADLFMALLANLNITEKVYVVGISIGGPAAIQFAIKYPARCKGLLLFSAITHSYRIEDDEALNERYKQMNSVYFKDVYCWARNYLSKIIPKRFIYEMLKLSSTENSEVLKVHADTLIKDKENIQSLHLFNLMTSPTSDRISGLNNDIKYARNYSPSYRKIKAPVFIAHSIVDRVVPYEQASKFKTNLMDAELFSFRAFGHAIWFGQEWNKIVNRSLDFLNRIENKETAIPKTAYSIINAIWVSNEDGSMLTITDDKTFTLDMPGVDENNTIKGSVSIDESKITFVTPKESNYCTEIKGVYQFRIRNNELQLTLIKDNCKKRRIHFTKGWFKL